MAELAAGLSVEDAQDDVLRFEGEDNATEVLRPKFQWRSKICHNMAVVCPTPRSGSAETSTSLSRTNPQSPAPSPPSISRDVGTLFDQHLRQGHITRMSPFSFDLRDATRRAAHLRKLEELEESLQTSFSFRANPVRKYKPLDVKRSSVPVTIPKWPFSREEP